MTATGLNYPINAKVSLDSGVGSEGRWWELEGVDEKSHICSGSYLNRKSRQGKLLLSKVHPGG